MTDATSTARPIGGRPWIKRNKWWLVAVLPAACAMMAAASFRYVEVYLPNDYTSVRNAKARQPAEFSFPVSLDGFDYTREGQVEVAAVQKFERDDIADFDPPADTELWGVLMKWHADPHAFINGCTVWLRAKNGDEYSNVSALLKSRSFDPNFQSRTACVPPKTPGPYPPSIFSPEPEFDESNPRPEDWKKVVMFVVPKGIDPESVRIAWEPPHFLNLELPEATQDIVPQATLDADRGRR